MSDVVEYSASSMNEEQSEDEQENHFEEPEQNAASRRDNLNCQGPSKSTKQSKERRNTTHVQRYQISTSGSSVKHSSLTAVSGMKVNSILKQRDVFCQKNYQGSKSPKNQVNQSDDDELLQIPEDCSEDSDSDEHSVKIATAERSKRPTNLRNLPVPKYNMLLRLNGNSVEMTKSAKKSRLG
jgi:hypothetical protein